MDNEEDFEEEYVWEARADYEDGTDICKYFPYSETVDDDKQQFEIEEWLVSRHEGCTWFSVNLISRDLIDEA